MSKKFFGYQLVKLLRAVSSDDNNDGFGYEVEHYNVFGERSTKVLKIDVVDRDYGFLRMSGDRMAVLEGGQSRFLDEIEYKQLVAKYEGAA